MMDTANSLDQDYEGVWRAFVAGGKIEPASGTRSKEETLHLVFLCPVGAWPDAVRRVAPVQQRLAFPYAELVPPERLHVSIQGFDVRPADWEEHREELLMVAGDLFGQFAPFTLRLGWPNSFPMAAILAANDGGMVRRLRAALRGALPTWTGVQRDPMVRDGEDRWLPHMSLAYYNTVRDNQALVEAIRPIRDQLVAGVPVTEIHLISTPRDAAEEERWVWPVHGVFELQGS